MKIAKSFAKKILNYKDLIISAVENVLSSYITYHLKPKFSLNYNLQADTLKSYSKVAIIIQGPLLKRDNFTLNTVKIYKKIFSNYQIILSTWEDEDKNYIDEFKKENIEIILNKKPTYPGIANINYQITSTKSAIKKSEELKMNYILKTRTDTRIYNQNSIEFLINLLETFPINLITNQTKRIAFPSLNTYKYRPYSVTDLVMFGTINDIIKYWDIELDTRKNVEVSKIIGEWSQSKFAEVYLSANYLKKIGKELQWTLADSWQTYAENFCVFNSQDIDLYWHKYFRTHEHRRLNYNEMRNDRELTFSEWLNLYSGVNNKKNIPEYVLKSRFTEIIKGDL